MDKEAIEKKIAELSQQHLDAILTAKALEGAINVLQQMRAECEQPVIRPSLVIP